MRNLLALAAAAVIAFVVVGWFLGWYEITSVATSSGKEYKVDINSPKITEDITKGKEKLREALDKEAVGQGVAPGGTVPVSYPAPGSIPGTSSTMPLAPGSVLPQTASSTPPAPRAVPPGVPQP